MLTGAAVDAAEALRLGMVHEIHKPGAIVAHAYELAAPLAGLSRETLAYTCAALRMDYRRDLPEAVAHGLGLTGMAVHRRR
jgi:enoyl-CoA hydratase/carnithine racemase